MQTGQFWSKIDLIFVRNMVRCAGTCKNQIFGPVINLLAGKAGKVDSYDWVALDARRCLVA